MAIGEGCSMGVSTWGASLVAGAPTNILGRLFSIIITPPVNYILYLFYLDLMLTSNGISIKICKHPVRNLLDFHSQGCKIVANALHFSDSPV
jgi:hypothetical protein